jgi:hypothetical protein
MTDRNDDSFLFRVKVLESEDGGRTVWEAVVTVADIYALVSGNALKIGNIRPDHEIIGYEPDGVTPRYANTSARISDWTEGLIDGTAILGTLSWNANPDFTRFTVERDEADGQLYLTLYEGAFDTEIDSASRHRAILRAVRHVRIPGGTTEVVDPSAGDLMNRKISMRIFSLRSRHGGSTEFGSNELIAEEVFTAMQNWGQSVNQSVTKYNFQKTPVQTLMRRVMDLTEHLGDNVETRKNTVSQKSDKVVAYNTWSMAGEEFWRIDLPTKPAINTEAQWLAEFWDELVKVRPELAAKLSGEQRRTYRSSLVSATALGFFGFIALASRMRGEDADFAVLEQLNRTVKLQTRGFYHEKGAEVDFFDFDNPLWRQRGVLVPSTNKDGVHKLNTRNVWQTRRTIGTEILSLCGYAV